MKHTVKESAAGGAGRASVVLAAMGILAVPIHGTAQSAEEILNEALELHEERLAGVEDIAIQQEMMGIRTVTHLVKEEVDGRPVLRVQSVEGMDAAQGAPAMPEVWAEPTAFYGEWAHVWTLQGEGSVEGHPTWILEVEDPSELDMAEAGLDEGGQPFEPERIVMELHQEDLVPLQVHVQGDVMEDGAAEPMEATIHFSDYREVEGYLHPHRMGVETDGSALGLTDDEMARALEELRELPPAQRQAMEEMMGDHMDFLMGMLDGDGLRMEMVVTDLRVNSGPATPR